MKLNVLEIREDAKELIKFHTSKSESKPCLAIVYADGYSKASETYIRNKVKLADECGIQAYLIPIDMVNESQFRSALNATISSLNSMDSIHGIIVQLPLPFGISDTEIANRISPEKDVDGFNCQNIGSLIQGTDGFVPATAFGIKLILDKYVELGGKDVLIINRSNIVGKPLIPLLLEADATVTVAHSHTQNLREKIKNADVVITAVGIPHFINKNDMRTGQVYIDVSMNVDENGKLCGDITKADYEVMDKLGVDYTTVPQGVGVTTVTALMLNTYLAWKGLE